MTDEELLLRAAKVAGYTLNEQSLEKGWAFCKELHGYWNPLEDNEDAFVLAVKLKLDIRFWSNGDRKSTRLNSSH